MNNNIPLIFLLVSIILEISIINFVKNKQLRDYGVAINSVFIMFSVSTFLFVNLSIYTVLLFLVSLLRLLNIFRLVSHRINEKELILRYTRTMYWLIFTSLLLVVLEYFKPSLGINFLLTLSFLGSSILFITTITSMIRWRTITYTNNKLDKLPTVSVCIPARNETQDLPECLETLLDSTYTKLEILVLDDCSHDKTPAIIKDYAHKGVRFIKGQEPSASWVAKNAAMDKLFDESRGEIVIFAGVDVRFKPESIYKIVEQLEYGLLDMISILPRRSKGAEGSVFIQPLRYWWELSVPRLFGKRPPALSTAWAVRRKKLTEVGGFESVRRSIRPEAHFAKRLVKSYKFLLAGSKLGLTSVKGPREQFDTAIRMRYPQTRRRPESLLAILLIESVIFFVPILTLVNGVINNDKPVIILSILSLLMLVLINLYISFLTVKNTWLIGLVSLPFLVLEEWYVLIRSMFAYEFGVVRWKERNICLPMLQVEKELPKI